MCDHFTQTTTSHKRPPIQNTKIFPVKHLQLQLFSKRAPHVSDRDHFFGPDDHLTHSLISMFAVCTILLRIYEDLLISDNIELYIS